MKTVAEVFDNLEPASSNLELAAPEVVNAEAKQHAGVVEWVASASSLVPEVAKLLDVQLPDVFVRFWKTLDEVRQKLDESLKGPQDTLSVSMFDSKTEASFEPYIQIRLSGGLPAKRIPGKVTLPLTFTSVVLSIRNGAIVGAIAGHCEIGGEVALGKVTVAKLRKPVPIDLARLWSVDDQSPSRPS